MEVLYERKGSLGVATLNRPQALNSINLSMFESLRTQLQQWVQDPEVGLIVIRGEGDRAFCSGGDVKSLALRLRESRDGAYAYDFFNHEYNLDYFIHTSKKPILVIGHGITMGGGLGVMVGATCRIVTQTSVLAMPEISIGFFTDVGASYFLNQLPDRSGLFLGLTGSRIQATDALYLGLADFYFEQESLLNLVESLAAFAPKDPVFLNKTNLHAAVKKLGAKVSSDLPLSQFKEFAEQIDYLCSASSVVEIEKRFRRAKDLPGKKLPWDLNLFLEGSPTSAYLIFELLSRGKRLTLKQCFDMEFNLALECCRRADFVEGVRALLIDKDRKPVWTPSQISGVDPQQIEDYFSNDLRI